MPVKETTTINKSRSLEIESKEFIEAISNLMKVEISDSARGFNVNIGPTITTLSFNEQEVITKPATTPVKPKDK